ncbi:MAG: hypothetical protein BA864_10215 [Desulfuromonadales bacterium C00003093]|nr:MAG: hypothetical protein BA864_10215 [Desulfuromonadales bacterium C00003093]
MISTKSLLYGVIALISIDVVSTLAAVGGMGATELNPLVTTLGFTWFMVAKVIISAVAVYCIWAHLVQLVPTAARYGLMSLVVVYGAVCASNVYQIMGAVV